MLAFRGCKWPSQFKHTLGVAKTLVTGVHNLFIFMKGTQFLTFTIHPPVFSAFSYRVVKGGVPRGGGSLIFPRNP